MVNSPLETSRQEKSLQGTSPPETSHPEIFLLGTSLLVIFPLGTFLLVNTHLTVKWQYLTLAIFPLTNSLLSTRSPSLHAISSINFLPSLLLTRRPLDQAIMDDTLRQQLQQPQLQPQRRNLAGTTRKVPEGLLAPSPPPNPVLPPPRHNKTFNQCAMHLNSVRLITQHIYQLTPRH